MMKIKDYIILAIALCSISLGIWVKLTAPKVAYVRTAELVNGFDGMKEASEEYQKKAAEWQNNIDSLKRILQREIVIYSKDSLTYSKNERIEKLKGLNYLQQAYLEYSKIVAEKAEEEDQIMTQRVLNKVNSYIEQYGKENDYLIILGTNSSGNIMYGEKAADITPIVLENLNKNYRN
ncbi:MAG: OmpH family outer membrane protein [Bacteroidetes bacterium]|nr:OmpH family outer membrane protein [Bacteroidota bacterium]HET6243902.1 OmpH family outer membrane protein [Bacteroidia bacterium]